MNEVIVFLALKVKIILNKKMNKCLKHQKSIN